MGIGRCLRFHGQGFGKTRVLRFFTNTTAAAGATGATIIMAAFPHRLDRELAAAGVALSEVLLFYLFHNSFESRSPSGAEGLGCGSEKSFESEWETSVTLDGANEGLD